jgi:L-cysteine S-thiosulfotransferase
MIRGRSSVSWRLAVALLACSLAACSDKRDAPRELAGADAARGLDIMERVGCAACHQIPGVAWPEGTVGGSLQGFANRTLIAGEFPNQPHLLVRWLRNAPGMDPRTAMPPQPMSEDEARDVAAYLYTLRDD